MGVAAGGTRFAITTLDSNKETSHRWPNFLPDGNHFLYFAHGSTSADSGIYLAALDSKDRDKDRKLVLRNVTRPSSTRSAAAFWYLTGTCRWGPRSHLSSRNTLESMRSRFLIRLVPKCTAPEFVPKKKRNSLEIPISATQIMMSQTQPSGNVCCG